MELVPMGNNGDVSRCVGGQVEVESRQPSAIRSRSRSASLIRSTL
jgi:hypothetical protein